MCFRKHLAELACLQCRPLTTWEHLEHHKVKNMTKTQDCWAARILYQTRMGQHSSVPKVQQLLSSVPTSLWSDVKEEEMLQSGKHDPAPTFWDVLLPSNSNITYFSWNYLFSQFKRLICFLCWIDWKICKSLHSVLFRFTANSIQTFLELELAYLCFLSFLLCVLVHFPPSAHITVCFANLSLFSSHTLSRHWGGQAATEQEPTAFFFTCDRPRSSF